ncbi:EF-hand domain-containing protein [Duganella callida]|nr:EF-hand domain-containing protein [Duganella callida]
MAISPLNSRTSYPPSALALSKEAQSISSLASKGITFTTIYNGREVSQSLINGTRPPAGSIPLGLGGSMSTSDFDEIMLQIGASQSQADAIKNGFDSNKDGSITNDEILQGLASLGSATNSANAQLLMGLMDARGNRDGVVQQEEFASVETSLASGLKK